jgi:HlyD family secretion protein
MTENRRPLRRLLTILIPLLLVAGVAAVYFFFLREQPPAPEAAQPAATGSPQAPERSGDLFVEGRLVPVSQATLAFEMAGQVSELLVEAGEQVEAGTALVRLDDEEQALALQQAEAALAQAGAELAAARAQLQTAEESVDVTELAVASAAAQRDLLVEEPSQAQVEAAESSVDAAGALVSQAAGERDVALETNNADIAAAEARLAAAEAALFAARIANEPLIQDPDTEEEARTQAEFRLNAAQQAVNAAQSELAQAQAGATEAEARAANSTISAAAYRRDVAQAQLDLLLVGARPGEVEVAEAAIRQAEQGLSEAEAGVLLAQSAVQQAEAELAAAEAGVAAAQQALERRTLRAPFAGTIARVHVEEAQVVSAGLPVVTLGDFSQWRVETTDLSELDVARFEEGMAVEVTFDAFPGETVAGEVLDIGQTVQTPQAVTAQSAQAASAVSDDVLYEATVALQTGDELPLRWGMTALVSATRGGLR